MEQQEVPAAWWDATADRALLAGVFKHGRSAFLCHRFGTYIHLRLFFFLLLLLL